ncbi:FtsX-like permease family protein [bacterium]|nr:FtsX-like permease family protein [bacterium]
MDALDIQEQPLLTLGRTVKITANGIRYRLFRSLVTVGVVAVAVAFLMNVLSESLVKRAVARRTHHRVAEIRRAAAWTGKLSAPGSVEEILVRLSQAKAGDAVYREVASLGRFADAEMKAYHDSADTAAGFLIFLSDLTYGRRRALIHNAVGARIFERLRTDEGMTRFTAALKTMRSVRLPQSVDELRQFIASWPKVLERTGRVQDGHRAAIGNVRAALKGRPILEALAEVDGAFGPIVREAGFVLDDATARIVAGQARRELDKRLLQETIGNAQVRQAVAARLDVLPSDVDVRTLWQLLRSRGSAEWYAQRLAEEAEGIFDAPIADAPEADAPRSRAAASFQAAARLGVDRLVELAETEAEERALDHAERVAVASSGGFLGMGQRMGWLVLASMLVCIVGISNAMLMSVTERFREIATLKCLGALDGFIMAMFVLEASFLGVVGGIVGAIGGTALGLGRMFLSFGPMMFAATSLPELLATMGIAVVLGVVLAALASVYPSLKAARLAPMEAMRIE